MPKYTVQSPLQHNGKRFEAGSTIELEAEAAKPLLAQQVLTESAAEPKKKEK